MAFNIRELLQILIKKESKFHFRANIVSQLDNLPFRQSNYSPLLCAKKTTMEWKGVMPAVTTKFTASDELDKETFQLNVRVQVSAGVHGIILGGTLGEASTLSNAEKNQLLNDTCEAVENKIPVVMNVAEQSTKNAITAAKEAQQNGASGLMLLPPMRYNASQEEVFVYFSEIAAATDLPIMVYNNPVDYKTEVTLDLFERLTEIPTIQAVKESTRNLTNVTNMINRFGDRFKILSGVDTLALESLVMGAHGWVAGLVDAFPHETVAIYGLVQAGKVKEAVEIYRWFMPLLELDISPRLVQNIKLAETVNGIGTEYVRKPRLPLVGNERKQVMDVIQQALDTRPDLSNYSHHFEKTTA